MCAALGRQHCALSLGAGFNRVWRIEGMSHEWGKLGEKSQQYHSFGDLQRPRQPTPYEITDIKSDTNTAQHLLWHLTGLNLFTRSFIVLKFCMQMTKGSLKMQLT